MAAKADARVGLPPDEPLTVFKSYLAASVRQEKAEAHLGDPAI